MVVNDELEKCGRNRLVYFKLVLSRYL